MSPAEELRARLRAELVPAMRERRQREVSVLRQLIQLVDNAEAVDVDPVSALPSHFGDGSNEVPRKQLSAEEIIALLESEAASRSSDADQLAETGQDERAAQLRVQVAIVRDQLARARAAFDLQR